MSIAYPLALPAAAGLGGLRITPRAVVGVSVSPFTGQQQVYAHQGQWWEAELRLPEYLTRDEGEQWAAFVTALNGRQGTFLAGDPAGKTPRGAATGTPLVNGAGQSGLTLATDGWTPSTSGILKAGDWIQIGAGATARLHKVVQDASSNGVGQASLEIWPRLRYSPADNAALAVSNTVGQWRLAANDVGWDIRPPSLFGLVIPCVEAL